MGELVLPTLFQLAFWPIRTPCIPRGCSAGGSPLGSLLFALAIQPLVERLAQVDVDGARLDIAQFYLHDGAPAAQQRSSPQHLTSFSEMGPRSA